MPPPTPLYDVLIIGAGPSGLSTATGLARQLHTTILFTSEIHRNAKTHHMHNVLGWDHAHPSEFRSAGLSNLTTRYKNTIQIQPNPTTIETIRALKSSHQVFEARDAHGHRWYGRKVVLATGVRDLMLDIEGYGECWANGIFHCLFCEGFEERGGESVGVLAIGVLGDPARAVHVARMAGRFARGVTVYTNGDGKVGEGLRGVVEGVSWLRVDERPIVRFEKGEVGMSVLVHLGDGESKMEGFLVHHPHTELNGPFAKQLGLALTEGGEIQTSGPFHETSVPGVFAVGDCATPVKVITQALATGTLAAAGLVAQLQAQPVPEFEGGWEV
ncbi:putative pyridine nucleotide-disulfide oxidoreductase [Aspergillus sclerotiicarbonarius CBS 121057]|uniref:Putative pyridine nucleotide-disulfide oxidoreductase n=1 Tax=Aspergillus sclerotiicarbonarius (strain CBS 121057 / IBT 28362) TaxID=1448318 RepID=A0A319DTZ9_ASPSB|nr:putative pyridine nucleotide-disulfide oxidoreductase [Aspergillus sclerotiicarbonarius CBS 121057]